MCCKVFKPIIIQRISFYENFTPARSEMNTEIYLLIKLNVQVFHFLVRINSLNLIVIVLSFNVV